MARNIIKVGLIQMKSTDKPQNNLTRALAMTDRAALQGAQIICLQELFKAPYFCQTNDKKFFKWAEPIPGPTIKILSKTAKKHGIVLVASLFEKTREKQHYNTAVVIDADGAFLGKYRKVHVPDDLKNHYSEKFYFKPGNLGFPVFKTRFGKIGVLVCWDQWYPEAARELALKGAEIIFYPTAIGWQIAEQNTTTGKDGYDAWVTIQRSHAIANGVFVAVCNRTGRENNINFWGKSFVCGPFGRMISQASHTREEIVLASCKMKQIEEVRKDWPLLSQARRLIGL